MKKWMLVFGLVAALTLFVSSAALAQEPELHIESPKEGATVKGPNVEVKSKVENFTLNAAAVGKAPKKGEGHIHWAIDGAESPTAEDSHTFQNVPAGSHTISATLKNNDHSDLSPAVSTSIKINVGTAEAEEAAPTGTSLPLIALLGALLIGAGLLVRRLSARTAA